MYRKARTRLGAAGASLVLGLTIAQMAIGAPSAVLTVPAPPAKSAPDAPTTIAAGDASVASQTGAFRYAVPIAVPPGRLGVEPSLSLHYSSQAPTFGGIAAGWSLRGFPEIRHDPSDGRQGSDYGFAWTGSLPDRNWSSDLAGGKRLVPVDDVGGPGVEATYRAMHDDGYVQYRRMASGHDYSWEARKPDGTVVQFGHAAHIDGAMIPSRAPITKAIDPYGNAVEYFYTGGIDYTPSRIEYTTNPGAGLAAHARVELEWDDPTYCNGTVPIGARLEKASGDETFPGAYKLRTIRTLAAQNGSTSSMRTVREIDLVYNDATEACYERHGPQRQLTGVSERAYAPDGGVTTLPTVTFDYGAVERTFTPQPSGITPLPGAPDGAIVWGKRYQETYRWPTVEAMMIDLDTDGFQDRLVMESEAECAFRWQRGSAAGFESPGTLVYLPRLPWPDGTPGQCSFAGQRALWTTLPETAPDPVCDPIGSYFSYRFLNLVGQDQRPDIVAAIHADGRYFNAFDDQTLTDLGLPVPGCNPGPGECPDLSSADLGGVAVCDPWKKTCTIDEVAVADAVAQAERQPCDVMFANASDKEDPDYAPVPCFDNPLQPMCWPDDPSPVPDPGGGDDTPQCEKRRIPQVACNQYVWYVWKNLGGGQFSAKPVPVLSPVPLESDTGQGSVGGSPFALTSSMHGLRDLNGDGHLDVFANDENVLLDLDDPGSLWWYVWFGDGEGGFHGVDDAPGSPYLWWTPKDAHPSLLKAGPGSYENGIPVFAGLEQEGLYDVNADGLPDFLSLDVEAQKIQVYYNNGLGFVDNGVTTFDWWSSAHISALTSTIAELSVDPGESYISSAQRLTHVSVLDLDADQRPDLQLRYCTKREAPSYSFPLGKCIQWTPSLLMNAGGTLTDGALTQTFLEQVMLREVLEVDHDRWWVGRRMTDVTGDGRDDFLEFAYGNNGLQPSVYTDDPAEPALRLMKRVDNGRGQTIDVDYAVHTDPEVVTQSPADGRSTANHSWVVSSMAVADAWGPTSTSSYRYLYPAVTPDWRGRHAFRGFEQIVTTAPSGAVTVEEYDYETDWSGRLAATTTYPDAAAHDADEPHTIEETHWRDYELFGGALTTFHAPVAVAWTCRAGQTRADCLADPAGRRTTATEWESIGGGVLYAPTRIREYAGDVPVVGGEVDDSAYLAGPDDRVRETDYKLRSDQSDYRLRVEDERLSAMATSELVERMHYIYDAELRAPIYERKLLAPGTWASTFSERDPATGVVLQVQKPVQVDEGSGAFTTFEYDDHQLFVTRVTNELGHAVETDYDYGTGAVLETRGPNAKKGSLETRRVEIDGLGRPLEVWVSVDTSTGYVLREVESYGYYDGSPTNPAGVMSSTRIDGDAWTKSALELDGSGRPIRKGITLTADGLPDAVEEYVYDVAGNLIELTVPDPSRETSGFVTYRFAYDSFGRQVAARNPDGTGTDTSYDGLTVRVADHASSTDPDEPIAVKLLVSDAFGRLIEVDEQLDDGSYATTVYDYDANDRVTGIVDPEGNETILDYDLGGRRTGITRGQKTWTYGYDLNGNLTTEILPHPPGAADLYMTTTVYDDLDRPKSVLAGDATLTDPEKDRYATGFTRYYYDGCDAGGPCFGNEHNLIGRMRAVELPFATIAYEYDAAGHATRERRSFSLPANVGGFSDTRTIESDFTDHGAPKSVTHADAATRIETSFDSRGLPRQLTWHRPNGDPVSLAAIRRNVAGKPWTYEHTSLPPRCTIFGCPPLTVQTRRWRYDRLGRVTADWVERPQGKLTLSLIDYWQTGDVKTLTSHAVETAYNGHTVDYHYDSRHQVSSAREITGKGDYVQSDFTYTPAGRLASAVVDSAETAPVLRRRAVSYRYSVDPSTPEQIEALERLGDGTEYASFDYDDQGNLTKRTIDGEGTWSLHHDGDGRLRELEHPSGRSEIYYYDHEGARMLALERSGTTPLGLRFWFGPDEIHYDDAGNQTETLVHVAAGTPIARIENGNRPRYTFHNGLGHLLAVTRHDGDDVAAFAYTAFGELFDEAGEISDHLRRFNGKETDLESGLSYYGFRYYDPVSLTWTRADPLYRTGPDYAFDAPRRGNLYSFSLNNPLSYADPDGLDTDQNIIAKEGLLGNERPKEYVYELPPGVDPDIVHDPAGKLDVDRVGEFLNDFVGAAWDFPLNPPKLFLGILSMSSDSGDRERARGAGSGGGVSPLIRGHSPGAGGGTSTWTNKKNAAELRKNLAREGRPVQRGQAAAHIVPSKGSVRGWVMGGKARALLEKYGIGINDAANGVALGHPRPHNFTHRRTYHQMVHARLKAVEVKMLWSGRGRRAIRRGLRRELRKIGKFTEKALEGVR